ncbi:MAG: Glu/Leu/Phe/Val dehydrogenase dimerization domain-containing protein [Myxococcota bacterium]
MFDPFALDGGQEHLIFWADPRSGLKAVLVLDDTTLGPAAGGIRTARYPDLAAAVADAARLARAMTLKCAISGLNAGGGKLVVIDHPGLDRARAFDVIGQRIDSLGGVFRTAGDLGTSAQDLELVARRTSFVHLGEADLAAAVARGMLRSIEAVLAVEADRPLLIGARLDGLRVSVQGAGAIGAAVCRALVGAGARVKVADVVAQKAQALAKEIEVEVVDPARILEDETDILAPCAIGGVVDAGLARRARARAIVGAANNLLQDEAVSAILLERKILHVPDVVASAGAVIDGIGASVMGLADRTELIDHLGLVAEQVLRESKLAGVSPTRIAEHRARQRIEHSRMLR